MTNTNNTKVSPFYGITRRDHFMQQKSDSPNYLDNENNTNTLS